MRSYFTRLHYGHGSEWESSVRANTPQEAAQLFAFQKYGSVLSFDQLELVMVDVLVEETVGVFQVELSLKAQVEAIPFTRKE
jgi:hypothetical protein